MLLIMEGFDWIDQSTTGSSLDAAMQTKWHGGHANTDAGIATGRAGVGSAYAWNTDINNNTFSSNPLRNVSVQSECIIGFAVKFGSSFSDQRAFLALYANGDVQVALRYETSNDTIELRRNDITLVATSPDMSGILKTDAWQYVEFKIKIDDSTGFLIMKVNGKVVWETSTNLNTQDVSDYWNRVWFRGAGWSPNSLWDDLYVCDSSGDLNNDFLGDVKVKTLEPVADGYLTDFSTSSGTNHTVLVDELPQTGIPGDTNYVQSMTSSFEMFQFDTLPDANAIQVNPGWRITEAQPIQVRGVARVKNHDLLKQSDFNDIAGLGFLRNDEYVNTPVVFETDSNGKKWETDAEFGVALP